jgi:3-deoxy-D-manno-octulosonate 8-phosphate phosphatase (KDO 8-P phosphatase)
MLPVKSKSNKPVTSRKALVPTSATKAALNPEQANLGLPARLKRITLFLCDVDGILTDGGIYMGSESEVKRFNIVDGLGMRFLQSQGIKVGWISNRPSYATTQRARDLKIDFLHQGDGNKVQAAQSIITQCKCEWEEVCYMGDDLVDLGVLRRVGVAVTVPHAVREVQLIAHYVTKSAGGHGAVREVVELILKAQGKWQSLVEHFSQ